jgi:hypothetical protein
MSGRRDPDLPGADAGGTARGGNGPDVGHGPDVGRGPDAANGVSAGNGVNAGARRANEARDPALDAAWQAHLHDDPPAALDDAILAAAHRAVGSTPRTIPASRARWNAWVPLATAATLAVLAFGIVQLVPREADHGTVASDVPAAAPPAGAPSAGAPAAGAPAAGAPSTEKPPASARSPGPLAAPAQDEQRGAALEAPRPSAADSKREQTAPGATAPVAARPNPTLEPDAEGKRNASAPARLAPPMTTKPAGATQPSAAADSGAATAQPQSFPKLRGEANAPPLAAAPAPAVDAAQPPPPAQAPSRERAAWSADDYVQQITRLRAWGDEQAASDVLRAFRARYADADMQLPQALRDWAQGVPR